MIMDMIDADKLRDYMFDHCGSAMMSGFSAAMLDVVDIEGASDAELCRMAERAGVDLDQFVIDGWGDYES